MRIAVLFLVGAMLTPAVAVAQTQAQAQPEARIMTAFERLGMDRNKAYCYGQIIGQSLDRRNAFWAASIVEGARSSQEVEQGVMGAGMPMMNAFSTAHQTCGS